MPVYRTVPAPWRQRLHDAAEAWSEHNRDAAWMWSPAVLAAYADWALHEHPALTEREADFLAACRVQHRRTVRLRRAAVVACAVAIAGSRFVPRTATHAPSHAAVVRAVDHAVPLREATQRADYFALMARARRHELTVERGYAIPLWIAAAATEATLPDDLHEAADRIRAARDAEGWGEAIWEFTVGLAQDDARDDGGLVRVDTLERGVAYFDPSTGREAHPHATPDARTLGAYSGRFTRAARVEARLVGGVDAPTLSLFDREKRASLGAFTHDEPVVGYDLSDDTRRLALMGARHVSLWDTDTRRRIAILTPHARSAPPRWPTEVRPLDEALLTRDGRRVVTLTFGRGEVWDAASGRRVATFPLSVYRSRSPHGVLPDAEFGLFVHEPTEAGRFIDLETGREIARLSESEFERLAEARHGPNNRLVLVDDDGGLSEVSHPSGMVWFHDREGLLSPRERYRGPTVSRDMQSRWALTFSSLRIWNRRTGRRLLQRPNPGGDARYVGAVITPEGGRILLSSSTSHEVWDGALTAPQPNIEHFRGTLGDAPFAPNGARVVTLVDRRPTVWSLATGRAEALLDAAPTEVDEARFSPDGHSVVAVERGHRRAYVWSVATHRLLHTIGDNTDAAVSHAALSPSGTELAIWTQAEPPPARETFVADRAPLLVSGLAVWRVATGAVVWVEASVLGEARTRLRSPAFPWGGTERFDTRHVVESVPNSCTRLNIFTGEIFDVRSGRALVNVPAGVDRFRSSQWTRDLRRSVRVDADGVSLWDTDPTTEAASAVLLGQTNLRVCRGSLAVIPVAIPRPAALADSPYASDDECRAAENASTRSRHP